ncbi:SDR family NAD(P)-dependent oxidoreductase [Sphingopyxis sp.]|uniref:SDR family NAD(P)-dependent oxidoreductase n=1 Tax=Sphingopyxis sp. TaxID=1908224 RepID=UPI003D0C1713
MNKFDLSGRKALITGAAAGIGAGTARALADAGAAVVIADIDEAGGRACAETLQASGATAIFVPLDVRSDTGWSAAIDQAISSIGGLDIVINNAGIEISSLLIDQSADDLKRMCDVNIVGTALGIKHGFRAMKPGGAAGQGGAIVNIASVAATIAFPGIGGYSATKSAVDRLTRIAAAEAGKLGYGVRVNCVCPGLVPTAMGAKLAGDMAEIGLFASAEEAVGGVIAQTPLGRLGEIADMADVIVFLCSDAARFVTGTAVSVDGGMGS